MQSGLGVAVDYRLIINCLAYGTVLWFKESHVNMNN